MIYCDIETLDFFSDEHIKSLPRSEQLAAMRFGCAVTYNALADEWLEWQALDLADLYPYLGYGADVQIAGWNVIDFDWPVIHHNAMRMGRDLRPVRMQFEDLFALIRTVTGRWYSLESVAQTNLGRGKLADGQQAAEWLRSGDPEQIAKAFAYCRHDVQLTIDLHAILLRGEPLRLPPREKRQELNEILWWLDGRTEWLPDAAGSVSIR